jgi:hypothetical protein
VAFFDLSMGLTAPAAGLLASVTGVGDVYFAAAVSVALSIAVALLLRVSTARGAIHG